jgi:hypothetical protein
VVLGPDPDFGEMSAVHSDQLSLYERGSSFPPFYQGSSHCRDS